MLLTTQKRARSKKFCSLLHAMMLKAPRIPGVGAHHEKQGATIHDGTTTSTHHVLPRLGNLPAKPRRNHRAPFLRTPCPPCRITSLVHRDGSQSYDWLTSLLVPTVAG